MSDRVDALLKRAEDSIRRQLAREGITPAQSWLFDRPSLGIRNGSTIESCGSEIVYRVSEPGTVLIVLYRRRARSRRSLANSFAGLLWFVTFLKTRVPELRYVSALVNVFPYSDENGISSERLGDFCRRCGSDVETVHGGRRIHLDLERFVALRPVERRSVTAGPKVAGAHTDAPLRDTPRTLRTAARKSDARKGVTRRARAPSPRSARR